MLRRWFTAELLVFVTLWLSLSALLRERAFYDPGSLWHIVVGEHILRHGIPQSDPFTFTFADHHWVPQQWGAELLMALLHRVGQLDFLFLVFTTGLAALYTWLFHRALHYGFTPLLAFPVIVACLFVGAFHYYVRPHMITLAGMAWTMALLVDAEDGQLPMWRLYSLPPLYALWTNLHGGVLGGLFTLGLALGVWATLFLLARWWPVLQDMTPWRRWSDLGRWFAVVLACALAPLLNPHGWEMFRIWQSLVGSKVLPQIVGEHMPLDPTRPFAWPTLLLAVAYLLLLLSAWPRVRISWWVPLLWFLLSFQSIRQAPLFAITVAVVAPVVWPHTRTYRFLLQHSDGTLAQRPTPRRWTYSMVVFPVALWIAASALQLACVPLPLVGTGWVRLSPKVTPIELKEVLQNYASSVPPGTPIFNDANFGGFLIYYTPTLKIFMDDRCELYGDTWLEYYAAVLGSPPEKLGPIFEQWQQRYGFTHALIAATQPPSSLEQYLLSRPDRWRELVRGQAAILFALQPPQQSSSALRPTVEAP